MYSDPRPGTGKHEGTILVEKKKDSYVTLSKQLRGSVVRTQEERAEQEKTTTDVASDGTTAGDNAATSGFSDKVKTHNMI